jgi:hypothetical protein
LSLATFFNFMLVDGNNVFLNFIPKLEGPSQQWKESVAVVWPVLKIAKNKCNNWLWILYSAIFLQNIIQYFFPKWTQKHRTLDDHQFELLCTRSESKNGSAMGLYISHLRNSPGYVSVRWNMLYEQQLSEWIFIPVKIAGLIKMCWNKTYDKVRRCIHLYVGICRVVSNMKIMYRHCLWNSPRNYECADIQQGL